MKDRTWEFHLPMGKVELKFEAEVSQEAAAFAAASIATTLSKGLHKWESAPEAKPVDKLKP
jgi:hypothetical protein